MLSSIIFAAFLSTSSFFTSPEKALPNQAEKKEVFFQDTPAKIFNHGSPFFEKALRRNHPLTPGITPPSLFHYPWDLQRIHNKIAYILEFNQKFGLESPDRRLVGKVSNYYQVEDDIDITCQLLATIHSEPLEPQERILITGEILTKVLAYRDLKPDLVIPVPTIAEDGEYVLTNYVVDKVFNLWNGMPAFGLIPEEKGSAAPIFLARGTDFSLKSRRAVSSILSDLDPQGPGFSCFMNSRSQIHTWLKKAASYGVPSRVMGFSLGGALASYTIVYESSLISQDENNPSLVFNTPGVAKRVYNLWQSIPLDERPPFLVYLTKKDPVAKVGYLFGNICQVALEYPLPSITAHCIFISGQPIFYLRNLQSEKKLTQG